MRNHTSRKTILLRLLIAFFLVVCSALYLLADRYLIEHVEIADVGAYVATATAAARWQAPPLDEAINLSSTPAGPRLSAATQGLDSPETIQSDDWNYRSQTLSIKIEKVATGSGRDALAYFVADVVLSDATQLSNAFAKNSFGRNIVAYTSEIAQANQAIFAINGDYYGFRGDGIVIRNGMIYRDIPTRSGLAFYKDGSMKTFDETQTSAQKLLDAGVWNTLSFGPALIENSVVSTGLEDVVIDVNFGNRPIQGPNPRTGVGMVDKNHFVFIVVDGRSPGYSRGVTLSEFAQIFQRLGCREAYNIDGGGSATMYFMGRVVNNPLGRNKERGTSDILYIGF